MWEGVPFGTCCQKKERDRICPDVALIPFKLFFIA
jgi:hypothetical protein